MAVPKNEHIFSRTNLFDHSMVWKIGSISSFDMLTNHARYNRPELDALIPNATYITILRHPVKQFESAFAYFNWGKHIHSKDPITTFVNHDKYINATISGRVTQNSQLFDLGLSLNQTFDDKIVKEKIQSLNNEMDLVLITEYFDESLLILRDLLCWSVDDILYISSGVRRPSTRRNLTASVKQKILERSKSDLYLYHHFERVLLKKIQKYGGCFEHNLREFRKLQNEVLEMCTENKMTKKQTNNNIDRPVLKKNSSEFCLNLWRGDVTFTRLNRKMPTI
ncbi:galactosylceramide sulfotransferase-like [Saccoglossus kowalevskii]